MIDYLVFYPLEFLSRIVTSWYWRRLRNAEAKWLASLNKRVTIRDGGKRWASEQRSARRRTR